MEKPAFLIIAGPNGSGKSSAYTETDFDIEKQSIWIINPDLLTKRIHQTENLDIDTANLQAVTRLETWLDATLDVHRTVGVETVLSTGKYRRLVSKSKTLGFQFWLIYIVLDSPELNIERVKIRVQKGGHDVPPEKIVSRYHRSLEQFPWFLLEADRAWIYDNSGSELKQVGHKSNGVLTLSPSVPTVISSIVDRIEP